MIELKINNVVIPSDEIHGFIEITREEGASALATITLIPPAGLQDLTLYQGKSVTIDWVETSDRLFTGLIDIPEFDIVNKTITLRCSNNRKELNNALDQTLIDSIGQYSDIVFGDIDDKHQEVEARLQTVPESLDYDASLNPHVTSWTPKTTADFVIDDCSIYRRQPRVEITNRSRIVNSIDVKMTYRYTAYRHREREFNWLYREVNGDEIAYCGWIADRSPFVTVAAIQSAANGAGWPIKEGITFLPIWETGWYTCGTEVYGFRSVGPRLDGVTVVQSANESFDDPATSDSRGEEKDYSKTLTLGASWTAAKRFTQRIEETVNINVKSSASITQYGEVANSVRYGYEVEQQNRSWESFDIYQNPVGSQTANGDYLSTDRSEGANAFELGINCAINRAKTEILSAHRQNFVTLQLPMHPGLDLRHTIETTSGSIQCKGKVYGIRHSIDVGNKFADTEVVLALSQIDTVETESPYDYQYPTLTDTVNAPAVISLGNWIGGRNGVPIPDADSDGFFTNYFFDNDAGAPSFDTKFAVKTPDIDDDSRDQRDLEIDTEWNISINKDTLGIVF